MLRSNLGREFFKTQGSGRGESHLEPEFSLDQISSVQGLSRSVFLFGSSLNPLTPLPEGKLQKDSVMCPNPDLFPLFPKESFEKSP